jgi:hypothetical protein
MSRAATILAVLAVAVSAAHAAPAVQAPSDRRLEARLSVIFGDPQEAIRFQMQRHADGTRSEFWTAFGRLGQPFGFLSTERHVRYNRAGKQVYQHAVTMERLDTVRYDIVDYRTRTWTTFRRHLTAHGKPPSPSGVYGPLGMAESFARQLRFHALEQVATETVDRQRALHVRQAATFAGTTSGKINRSGQTTDLWLDASTFLLLRVADPRATPHVQDYAYLPRTPDTVAQTRVIVPRGFRHVTTPYQESFRF